MGWLHPSGEQDPKPTDGLMAVSLLWATLPSCLRHMGWDSVRGREEIPGCMGLMMGSGTSTCALCRMATYQGSPSFSFPPSSPRCAPCQLPFSQSGCSEGSVLLGLSFSPLVGRCQSHWPVTAGAVGRRPS